MTSCMAMESASSMDHPTYSMKGANLTDQKDKIDLSPILQRLQDSVLKFWLDEMKTFKRDLSQEYPHQFDSNLENSNVLNDVTMMLQKCARKGALKITLHSLRNSNQESLARTVEESEVLRTCQEKLKSSLRIKSEYVFEGLPKQGCPTLLNDIYTDMYITEGGRGEVEDEHEVGQIVSKRAATQETVIKSNDIFNLLPGQEGAVRTVLTKGVAGIGKTISVQKVILDWAEGKANQDICFILALPFRELNLIKHKDYSLIQIIHNFFPEMQEFKCIDSDQNKVLLIFDGLDECRLPLDFQNNETCCDAHESVSVDVVLTNLIKGNLLPSALLWITTRPAAANRIPPECFDRVTEVRGFNDQQKEEYLIKKILDKSLASRITTHMKSSRSLYILCHIPVICWIVATVLQGLLVEACSEEIPCTLTQMYSNLVALQLRMKSKRSQSTNQSKSEDDIIQKLGKLAFQQLETGNLVFYEEDLKEIGIDVSEASEYCSWFTEIFKEKSVLHQNRIFYFVHLSVQEFLAALFVFLTFQRSGKNLLDKSLLARLSLKGRSSMNLYKSAVDRALQSQNGHLDLFLRFLLGLSLESNQAILKGFMTQTQAGTSSEDIQRTVQYIKEKIREYPSPQRCINLFHCLNELNDKTLVQEIQSYLSLGSLQLRNLTPTQWSALAFVLLTSQEDLDVFDLKKYVQSDGGLLRLLPVVRLSKIARLDGCNLTDKCCEALASVMGSSSSLVELDLSDNNLQDSGVKLLSKGLGNPHCKLEILRLSLCGITDEGCVSLAMALSSNPTHLKELDLSFNYPEESGVEQLSAVLEDPHCKLEALSIDCLGSSREKWRLLKYACQLTLDSNTANKMLRISEDGRNVENTREVQLYADHPDRFSLAVQVLCGEGLSDRCYWEVEFGSKKTKIAATYRGIPKMEEGYKSWLGWNEMSWSWYCTDGGFSARHNRKRTPVCAPPTDSNRVGVYMDWPAGTLTLYSVTSDMVTLLHTFYTSFTEPIYPAFSVVDTLCLCPIETPYERHEYAQ